MKHLILCEEPLLEYQLFSLFSPSQLKAYVVSLLHIPLFFLHFLNLLLKLDRGESSQRYCVAERGSQTGEWDPNKYSCWGKGSSMISTTLSLIGEFRTTGSQEIRPHKLFFCVCNTKQWEGFGFLWVWFYFKCTSDHWWELSICISVIHFLIHQRGL